MAGPARTGGRYVDRELEAHGGRAAKRVRREAERRWSQWPKVDQRALIAHFTALEDAEHRRDAAAERAGEMDAALEYDTSMGLVLLPARTAVHDAQVALEAAQQAVEVGAAWLNTFYQGHHCSGALVAAAAADLATATLRRVACGAAAIAAQGVRAQPEPQWQKEAVPDWPIGQLDSLRGMQFGTFHDALPVSRVAPGEWQGPFNVYFGQTVLITAWVLRQEGQIIDTMIRKDVDAKAEWNGLRWWDDVSDYTSRLPREIVIHRALQGVPTSPQQGWSNILNLRNSGLNKRTRVYTLYMELAQYGTLYHLLEAYLGANKIVPEAFIWYTFLVLAECAVAMQHGHIADSNDVDPTIDGWQEIVHFDLKPPNIFLTAPNSERFADYPAPKLGDFGHAFQTYDADPHNPELFADNGGTENYRAPEQRFFWETNTQHPVSRYKLGAHTNIYATGLVIREMMMLGRDITMVEPSDDTPEQLWPGEHAQSRLTAYSSTLADIVTRCCRYLPYQRLTPVQLREELMQHLTNAHPDAQEDSLLQDARDLFSNNANAEQIRANSIYRDPTSVDTEDVFEFRPERGGDARFRHGPLVGPREINKPLQRMARNRNTEEIGPIGQRDSWHRALRGE